MVSQARHKSASTSTARDAANSHRFGSPPAMQAAVLALNRNYMAVHVISVRRAFCLIFKELAEVIHVENGRFLTYDFDGWREYCELKLDLGERKDHEDWIRAVNFEIQVPRVIRLSTYDRLPKNTVKFNRRNIFLRDGHRCQYCGNRYSSPRLSLDHVMPKSRGGPDTWENIVCACLDCNVSKGGRTPQEAGMPLLQKPSKPKRSPLLNRQLMQPKYESWKHFIPQVSE
ncbi:HNH endonuclease [Thalassoglobus polymorphus]|uniref:HNH endonuclease n=2 Tax=Thalassoglobus polymorphus TaxID=2527994 RepID=A0A517QUU3_9PLAN|nr:HNH endonuclease [Thalassoglobus polymorphus]QDT35371.1 HNH endonuclease [Thalassoglobus polymorphus]